MNPFSIPYFHKQTEAAPLAVFRVLFGFMLVISIIRFWLNGWIDKLYIQPNFFFSYYGFEWVKPLGGYTYLLFVVCGVSAALVAIGYKYRIAIVIFFLSFTYIELMDKTTYLNHYYFVSLIGFVLMFLPADRYFSIDAYLNPKYAIQKVPKWTIDAIKLLLVIVYFYAGLAKLNSDWLVDALPLKIWLPGRYDLPIIGKYLSQNWLHYAFSWGGAAYDLLIPFLLLFRKTRSFAFAMVVLFHLMTRVLFPIGMFPYIMIVSALIFFDSYLHHRLISNLCNKFGWNKTVFDNGKSQSKTDTLIAKSRLSLIIVFFAFQLMLPFRYVLYPGELFWTEQGFRFSWRVMLMEKSGYASFKIVNNETGKWFMVDNSDFLTSFQEKQMSFQPDFILEYAHYLKKHFENQGHTNIAIYADSYVTLNGRLSKRFINPDVDLIQQSESFRHKHWILPFGDEIKGL